MSQVFQPRLGIRARNKIFRLVSYGSHFRVYLLTNLIQYKNKFLALGFSTPNFFLQYLTAASFGISRVEYEHNDIGLFHNFM